MKKVKGKRGRPPSGPISGKSSTLGLRVMPETRNALEQAAKFSGRTMSQEAEVRLIRSFEDQSNSVKTIEAFGGPESAMLFQVCWHAVRALEFGAGKRWFDDPFLYRIAIETIAEVLRYCAPDGQEKPDALPSEHIARAFGAETLSRVLASTALASMSRSTAAIENGQPEPDAQWDGTAINDDAMKKLIKRVQTNIQRKIEDMQ